MRSRPLACIWLNLCTPNGASMRCSIVQPLSPEMPNDAAWAGWQVKRILAGVIGLAGTKASISCCVSLLWESLPALALDRPAPMTNTWPQRCLPFARAHRLVCRARDCPLKVLMLLTKALPESGHVDAGENSDKSIW